MGQAKCQMCNSEGGREWRRGKIYINQGGAGHILGTHLIYFAKVSGLGRSVKPGRWCHLLRSVSCRSQAREEEPSHGIWDELGRCSVP
jgi:hypothetical protein